jgi:hypothetical protein
MPLSLTACVSAGRSAHPPQPAIDPNVAVIYTALSDEPYLVPAVDVSRVPPQYVRQVVGFQGQEQPGSIVVDPSRRFLYLVQENGLALRYGCGVGKAGFDYQYGAVVGRKAAWPRWTPTPDMIKLEPERYGPYTGGVEGGLASPLGARAVPVRARHALPHPRHARARHHRPFGLQRVHPALQPGHRRPASARARGHQRHGAGGRCRGPSAAGRISRRSLNAYPNNTILPQTKVD